jgi:hypothetical protein
MRRHSRNPVAGAARHYPQSKALSFWKTQFSRLPTLRCCGITVIEFWGFDHRSRLDKGRPARRLFVFLVLSGESLLVAITSRLRRLGRRRQQAVRIRPQKISADQVVTRSFCAQFLRVEIVVRCRGRRADPRSALTSAVFADLRSNPGLLPNASWPRSPAFNESFTGLLKASENLARAAGPAAGSPLLP